MMRALFCISLLSLGACRVSPESVLTLRDLAGPLSPIDAGYDAGNPSLCTLADVVLCDGFEAQQIQNPPWSLVQLEATVSLDATRAYRGTQSLHVSANAGNATDLRQGELTELVALPQPDFFLRVFLYMASDVPDQSMRLAGLLEENTPELGAQLEVNQNVFQLDAPDGTILTSATPVPLDQWICLEWEVDTSATGVVHLWLNGDDLTDIDYMGDTRPANGVGRFSVGAFVFPDMQSMAMATPAYDFWFDELIVDSSRIGCTR